MSNTSSYFNESKISYKLQTYENIAFSKLGLLTIILLLSTQYLNRLINPSSSDV